MVEPRESGSQVAFPSIEDAVGRLVPEVEDLLRRVSGYEPHTAWSSDAELRLASPVRFPDGVGSGNVVVDIFKYRDGIRLDVRVLHNRVFAQADGTPTKSRCFLNDYVGSVSLEADVESLPQDFIRQTVAGVSAAREAVRRHNRRGQGPWEEIHVAAGEDIN